MCRFVQEFILLLTRTVGALHDPIFAAILVISLVFADQILDLAPFPFAMNGAQDTGFLFVLVLGEEM